MTPCRVRAVAVGCFALAASAAVAISIILAPAAPCRAAAQSPYVADMAAFFKEADANYPFFDLKGIRADWDAAKRRLAPRTQACRSDAEFLGLVVEAMKALRDAHMTLEGAKAEVPRPPAEYTPGVAFLPGVKNTVIVMSPPQGMEDQLRPGTVVATIDGKPARAALDERARRAWAGGGFFSSPQRARLFEYRTPLRGPQGEKHVLGVADDRRVRTVPLACTVEAGGWPHTYNLPKDLESVGRSFQYARLPGGAGYMYIRRVDESVAAGMQEAFAKIPDARGWVADLCGNGGGGYDDALINAVKAMPRPVAVITDAGCISAGETLARDFVQYADAKIFGERTAGSSTSKQAWAFPSGIATVRFSTRSRYSYDRSLIEFNGVVPHVEVEAVAEEVAAGQNSAILRAAEYLKTAK
jgi:hypothetical protein